MTPEQLREIDLNQLVVLDVLLQERSVTLAAQRLHLTPSAVSHALKRLRELFDDELLVRDGRRMSPTVRAQELSETIPNQAKDMLNDTNPPRNETNAHYQSYAYNETKLKTKRRIAF